MFSLLLSVAFIAATPTAAKPPVIAPIRTPAPVVVHPAPRGAPIDLLAPTQALERRWLKKMTAEEAIAKATAQRNGVVAVFEVTVRRTEQVGVNYFLGTEDDYRDPRNLAIRITRPAQAQLRQQFGPGLDAAFVGGKFLVSGKARRVRIAFLDSAGRRTGRYYYQTHVDVQDARQIERAPA